MTTAANYSPAEARAYEVGAITRNLSGTVTCRRVLAALGHPGYGEAVAAACLTTYVEQPTRSLHSIVYAGGGL